MKFPPKSFPKNRPVQRQKQAPLSGLKPKTYNGEIFLIIKQKRVLSLHIFLNSLKLLA